MQKVMQKFLALVLFFSIIFSINKANSEILQIAPVAQQTPMWCFAASSEMILKHLGYPNLNQAGNYQCAVVAAQGGICMANCGACLNSGGTIQNIASILQSYSNLSFSLAGYQNPTVRLNYGAILSPQEIVNQINNNGPILAGISPSGIPYPPGAGVSEHAVVIVGYEANNPFIVVVNDPWPANAARYLSAGGVATQTGQYKIPLSSFVNVLHYGNSLTFR